MKKVMALKWLMMTVCLLAGNSAAEEKKGPLIQAVWEGNITEVRQLLARGVNIDERDAGGSTPLIIVAGPGPRFSGVSVDIFNLLLNHGADVNATDEHGETPMSEAARAGRAGFVRQLMERGANIHTKDFLGRTPLHWAAWFGYPEVVRLLLDRGADTEACDEDGASPVDLASRKGYSEIVTLIQNAKYEREQNVKTANQQRMESDKKQAAQKFAQMSLEELVAEQPLDSEGYILALSDALFEADLEKLPVYLLQPDADPIRLRVEVKKRLAMAAIKKDEYAAKGAN
ncbi:MAG: ankyrin repeat domain-containing protein [Kiritimatiellales bacterium]